MPRSSIIHDPIRSGEAARIGVQQDVPAGAIATRVPVLLVEDMAGLDYVLAQYIKRAIPGAEVDICRLESAARLKLRERDYKVVVIDYQLPDGNGANLLRELVRQKKQIGVVLQSALEEVAGVSSPPPIINKPVSPADIDVFVRTVRRAAMRPLHPVFAPQTVLQFARSVQTIRVARPGLFEMLRHGTTMREAADESGIGYEAVRKATLTSMVACGIAQRDRA